MRKRRKKTQPDRNRELGIFSMMRFDSAISSFLVLLVIKSYRENPNSAKTIKEVSKFRCVDVQNHILSLEFDHVTHMQDLKCKTYASFVGQYGSLNSEKDTKFYKF